MFKQLLASVGIGKAKVDTLFSNLDSIETESHKVFDITSYFGQEDIDSMYAENHYGKLLLPHLSKLMVIMRLSSAIGNPGMSRESFSSHFGSMDILQYPLKEGGFNSKDTARLDSIVDCHIGTEQPNCKQGFHHLPSNKSSLSGWLDAIVS